MNEKSVKLETKKVTDKNEDKIMKYLQRKNTKHLVEKKRRERINKSLNELKKIIFADCPESLNNNKMEKAHILEMAVKHFKDSNRNADNQKTVDCGHTGGEYRCGYLACVNKVLSFISTTSCQIDLKNRLIENITEMIPNRTTLGPNEAKPEILQHNERLCMGKSTKMTTLNCGSNNYEQKIVEHNMKTSDKSGSNHVTHKQDKNELFSSQYNILGIQNQKTMASPRSSEQIMLYLIPISPIDKHLSDKIGNHDYASNYDYSHESTTQFSNLVFLENETNACNLHGNIEIKPMPVQNDFHKLGLNLSNQQVWRPW